MSDPVLVRATVAAPGVAAGRTLWYVAFDAAGLGVWQDPTGTGRGVAPHTAAEALKANPDALWVLDGPMFTNVDKKRPHYSTYLVGQLDYALYDARGVKDDGGPKTDARGATLSVVNGAWSVAPGDAVAPGASAAVQGYPWVVRDGAVLATRAKNTDSVWRAGVGALDDGRLVFLVGKMPMWAFGEAALGLRIGVRELLYTDGGGSTRLARRGQWAGSSENRRVASWLLVRFPLPPPAKG